MNRTIAAATATIAILGTASHAGVVTVGTDADISREPFTIDLGAGNTLTFSTVASDLFDFNPDGLQTGGSLQVISFGAPFYSMSTPTEFFTNRGGAFGPADIEGSFASYSVPTAIPYSLSEGLVEFGFSLADGFHYGYADLAGPTLYGYRYNDTPDGALALAPVPEPGTWTLMIAGLFGLGLMKRRLRGRSLSARPDAFAFLGL